jgi:hypothetical protein
VRGVAQAEFGIAGPIREAEAMGNLEGAAILRRLLQL